MCIVRRGVARRLVALLRIGGSFAPVAAALSTFLIWQARVDLDAMSLWALAESLVAEAAAGDGDGALLKHAAEVYTQLLRTQERQPQRLLAPLRRLFHTCARLEVLPPGAAALGRWVADPTRPNTSTTFPKRAPPSLGGHVP